MSHTIWLDQKKKDLEVDVCIIGAGIAGLSVAYWLEKQMPDLKLTIVEKNQLGSGATGRNAGFVTCGSVEHFNRMVTKHGEAQALEIWNFSEENLNLLKQEIVGNSGDKIDFYQQGAFSLAAKDNELNELKEVAEIMKRNNISVDVLNQNDVKSRLGAEGFVGGIKYIDDAEVHPVKLLKAIKEKLKTNLIENEEVYKIEEAGQERFILTPHYKIKSTFVVICCNGYSSSINSYFEDKIYPTRGQIMVLEKVPKFMEGPCYANFYLDYFRQLNSGELIIGGFRQLEKDTEKGFSDHTTEAIQEALHDFVKKHLPQFQDSKVIHRWAGVMGFSADGEPMVGSLPNDNQLFFLGGFTGHGLGLAFHGAKTLVDLMAGNQIPEWISSKRF